jgi:hypothetical protein
MDDFKVFPSLQYDRPDRAAGGGDLTITIAVLVLVGVDADPQDATGDSWTRLLGDGH